MVALPQKGYIDTMSIIVNKFTEYEEFKKHSLSILACIQDCFDFLNCKFSDSPKAVKLLDADATVALVGQWVFWNIMDRSPKTDDEFTVAFVFGKLVYAWTASWWQWHSIVDRSLITHEGFGGQV